ncbi:MAG: hypothetical protein MI919_11580, partial [Holophagales bacterium]|nr:hypothetical protein [Holophagales bacterium]
RTVAASFVELAGQPVGLFITETGRGLRLDLSAQSGPALAATWDLPVGASPYAVEIVGDMALVADFYSGLRIAAARDLGQSLGRVDGVNDPNGYEDLAVEGNHAFLADWVTGLVVADFSDPEAPERVGFLPLNFPNALDVEGNLVALVSATNGGRLFLVDVSDPASPTLRSTTAIGDGADVLFHQGRVLVADESFDASLGGLRVFDVADPASPQQLGRYPGCGSITTAVARGDLAFVLCSDARIDVVDLSDPSMPFRVGRFEDPEAFGVGRGMALSGPLLYAALGDDIKIFDISGGSDPVFLDTISLGVNVWSMAPGAGGDVWVATALEGLYHLGHASLFADGFESGDLLSWSSTSAPRGTGIHR